MRNYNYKCVVARNGMKMYYKNTRGKWKRISNKVGMKAEKGKRKYGSELFSGGSGFNPESPIQTMNPTSYGTLEKLCDIPNIDKFIIGTGICYTREELIGHIKSYDGKTIPPDIQDYFKKPFELPKIKEFLKYDLEIEKEGDVWEITELTPQAAFLKAVEDGSLDKIRELLGEIHDEQFAELKGNEGMTPLHIVSYYYYDENPEVQPEVQKKVIEVLLEKAKKLYPDVDRELSGEFKEFVNATDDYDRTPLHLASEDGNPEVVELLLENGADVNAKDDFGTPLHDASRNGRTEVVELLLERGAEVEAKNKDGRTPLHDASRNGHTKIAKLLLENGKDLYTDVDGKLNKDFIDKFVDVKDKKGVTPLHYASWDGYTDIAKVLLERGANINAKTKNGETLEDFVKKPAFSSKISARKRKTADFLKNWKLENPQ